MTTDNDNKFKYNAKELEDDHNLYWYHYGARFYDPQLGRWHTVDQVDEFHSPYIYVRNNPILLLDPDGMDDIYYNERGKEIRRVETGFWSFDWLFGDFHYLRNESGIHKYNGFNFYYAKSYETIEFAKKYGAGFNISKDFIDSEFRDLITIANENTASIYRVLTTSVDKKIEDGGLDFKLSLQLNTLYLINYTLYNRNETGNFMWAYYLRMHNMTYLERTLPHSASIIDFILHDRKWITDEPWDVRARGAGRRFYDNENN
ncbi:MAG: hypothetical protein K8R79_03380 [Calditrichales bacterium]|nr:hypothetical protein [Calditrichales bacterium]